MLESLAKLSNILDKTCAILEIDLVSFKAIGGKKKKKKKKNSAMNGIIMFLLIILRYNFF